MNFDFDEQQTELHSTVARALTDALQFEKHEARGAGDRAVWNIMAELGLFGLLVPESHGGLGLSLVDLALIAEELGARLAPQSIIDTLDTWNIVAVRRAGAPGVYVGDAKIAALGLRVRRGCSFHGLAFNVAMDLEPFHRINPCGYQGLAVTQVLDLGGPSRAADVEAVLIEQLCRQLGLEARNAAPTLPVLQATVA